MLLDDESSDHGPLLSALSERGFRCEEAFSPDEAARRLGEMDFEAVIAYQRVAPGLDDFVGSARARHRRLAIIVVQTRYDGDGECRLFDLGADDVVTCEYSAGLVAVRTLLRVRNRREMIFP